MAMTITDANGNIISLGDATGRAIVPAKELQTKINDAIVADATTVGIYTDSGTYQASSEYQYLVVSDDTDTAVGPVIINNNGFTTNNIEILAGRTSGITYNANDESGQIINTVGSFVFNGSGKIGEWTLYSGNGNSTIISTDGNNKINTGAGASKITLGTGNNSVFSQGQDTITGGGTGYQSVTLSGAKSEVTLGDSTFITDTGGQNTLSVGKNSTITGGDSGTITFNTGDQNVFQAGTNDTVNAIGGSSLRVVHGSNNSYTVDQKLQLFNSTGNTAITTNGQLAAFGASSSNYTVKAGGTDSGLFVANIGNETLNASGSTVALQIYANTVSGAVTNFIASGGAGNDTLVAGTGNSTFSGGAGDNLFMFTKETSQNGNTVITDFANNNENKIALYNYGLDGNTLAQLLLNSQNDASGSAVLNLEGHSITVQNVSIADLNVSQFQVGDVVAKTA